MNEKIIVCISLMIPFFGTIMGSFVVFICKNKENILFKKIFLGFSAGVMLAASIWSLIIPGIEMLSKFKYLACFPVTVGIILGVLFLFYMEKIILKNPKNNMLNFAITLHNIPEGMAVGAVIVSALKSGSNQLLVSALIMSIGIGIQNIPEGMAISLPSFASENKKWKAFCSGVLSGIVEPIFACVTLLISRYIVKLLPIFLGIAAGSMMYVVIKELIPETQEGKFSNVGLFGIIFGFLIMMILDVVLG